ncbi:MAG TPA: VWA domain-containing protein [Thermoanaerobaculia bacterium]|nr:VWA domain-containing protein [Thermoanaerobaculia bacterium]
MTLFRRLLPGLCLAALAASALPLVHAQSFQIAPPDPADPLFWPEPQRAFFQDGPGLLLSADERQRFAAADEAGREAFLAEFLGRDPLPRTPANELKIGIERRQRLALAQYLSPRDVRAQLLFLNGTPAERKVIDCGTAFKPIEIWTYRDDRGQNPGEAPVDAKTGKPAGPLGRAVVYQAAPDEPFRYWSPIDGKRALYVPRMAGWLDDWEEFRLSARRFDLQICKEAPLIDQATGVPGLTGGARSRREKKQIAAIAASGYGIRPWTLAGDRPEREAFLDPPKDLARWALTAVETPLPEAPAVLTAAPVEIDFPEKAGQRMLARAIVRVTADEHVKITQDDGKPHVNFIVEGVLEHDGKVFDEFRVRYRLSPPNPPKTPIDLSIDRELRPDQDFLLRLKVRDEAGGAERLTAKGFRVPREPSAPVERTTAVKGEAVGPLLASGPDTLALFPPDSDVVVGVYRAEAIVTGKRIAKVTFLVDGKVQLTRNGPPYTAEVRLSSFPTEQTVRAEGFDEAGKLVAADEVILNEPHGVFRVAIQEPRRGAKPQGKVTARAEVSVPEERRVESVEFKLNDKSVATLTRPPWETPITVPEKEATVYLTVAARLDDGQTAEDTRFLRSPEYVEEVDVDLVELYAAVTDASGSLVRGLTEQDFQILEGTKPQKITKFELVENLPLVVGIAIDTSGSMAASLSEAESAAAGFLTKVVRRKDRCFALSFSGRPVVRMPLTDDVEAVGRSLEGLQAVGATAMHDAIVHALYYYRGTHGQKVLVLLSDGDDTSSEIPFKDALEYAKRSGVAIYTIGLNVPRLATGVRSKLNALAAETGGQTFFISKASELASVYERIGAELHSRYLLAFNAERKPDDKSYHAVEVKVLKSGLKARTAHGYYP